MNGEHEVVAEVISVLENQQDGMGLDEAFGRLTELHEATGADFGISLTCGAHWVWNAEVRVTPVPHDPDTSDRSYACFRAGPAEWALCQAVLDVLRWLAGAKPEYTSEPCLDCANNEEYGGAS
jgi:hypothetical protein